jgi:hypothetical protein
VGPPHTSEVEGSSLFLLSKMRSRAPEVIDDETNKLKHHAGLSSGLLLASLAAPAHKPVMLAGYRKDGEIVVRTQDDYDPAIASIIRRYPPLTLAELQLAAEIASQIADIEAEVSAGTSYWRLFRVLQLYLKTRTIIDNMERLHQYCRCIEGLIVPNAGDSGKKFKSRTELFIGPRHHDMMGETYDVRSDVEHLHENKHLETFDREATLELVKKLEMMEFIARTALVRIVLKPKLWPHFANTTALQKFWALEEPQRRALWGDPIDPTHARLPTSTRAISPTLI